MTVTTDGNRIPLMFRTLGLPARFWLILLAILISDQVTKWIIVEFSGFVLGLYPPFGGLEIVPGFFNLVYAVNYGAAWGMLEGFSWLLITLAVVVLVLIAAFRNELGFQDPVNQICFGLISGGIVGNTIDRIFRGHVVDFLDFHLPWYRWPTFNIADSAIVIGTLWYIYLQFRPVSANSG
ncbi:MAG TPA: signal peptidase II [Oceanipulchritudo sp.]|nr:signal peptidase II [Oceanipulchritudo sp.]